MKKSSTWLSFRCHISLSNKRCKGPIAIPKPPSYSGARRHVYTQKMDLNFRHKIILLTNKSFNPKKSLKSVSLPPIALPLATVLSPLGYLANADTGATGNYLSLKDISFLRHINICTPTTQIRVQAAYGEFSIFSHYGYLDIPGSESMLACIFQNFTGSLISISQIVNLGLTVTYCGNFVTMI